MQQLGLHIAWCFTIHVMHRLIDRRTLVANKQYHSGFLFATHRRTLYFSLLFSPHCAGYTNTLLLLNASDVSNIQAQSLCFYRSPLLVAFRFPFNWQGKQTRQFRLMVVFISLPIGMPWINNCDNGTTWRRQLWSTRNVRYTPLYFLCLQRINAGM